MIISAKKGPHTIFKGHKGNFLKDLRKPPKPAKGWRCRRHPIRSTLIIHRDLRTTKSGTPLFIKKLELLILLSLFSK
jgi:hypothetical protein